MARLFANDEWTSTAPGIPAALTQVVATAGQGIGWQPYHSDFKHDRLDGAARQAAGIDPLKRRYNRVSALWAGSPPKPEER